MQENPRYSLDAIRLLLAQYLDGALDADRLMEAELLLDSSPEARAELLKLQQAKGRLQASLQASQVEPVNDAWQNICHQLKADECIEPQSYDFEFISAYYDGELDPKDPACLVFEAQLFNNADANRMLSDVDAVSEAIRRFAYRQEEACSVDMTEAVMCAYQAESEDDVSVSPEVEAISAFVDKELVPKEVIALNRLLEQDAEARLQLARFTQIADWVQAWAGRQVERCRGDYWPAIQTQLQAECLEQRASRQKSGLSKGLLQKVALPAAAAAFLVVLSIPALRDESAVPTLPGYNHVQLASVPMGASGAGFLHASHSVGAYAQNAVLAQPLEPSVEPERQLVSREVWDTPQVGRAPSSEEYLFRALEEEVPNTDVSAIFGK